jgi:hypothetical protein
MVSIPGPPLADRLAMQDALDKLETVQPAVLIPPAVILPGGAVGVIVPPAGAPGAPGPGAPGVPAGPGALTPTQEINQDIINLFNTATFTQNELDDIENKITVLADPIELKEYNFIFREVKQSITIIDDIKLLVAKAYTDPAVQKIEADIKSLGTQVLRDNLNLFLTQKMKYLGVKPPSGVPTGPPVTPGGPVGPPGLELIYTYDELKDLKDKKDPDYKNFINSIAVTGVGFYKTPIDKWPALGSAGRDAYVDDWKNNNKIDGAEYLKLVKGQMSRKYAPGGSPDPEGLHSNERGFIHKSMR